MSSDDGAHVFAAAGSLEEQAAAFYVRKQRDDWTPGDQAELEAWLTDPAHQRAFREVRRAWQMIGEHAASPELITLRGDALRRSRRDAWRQGWFRPGVLYWRWALGASMTLLLGVGLRAVLLSPHEASYRTSFGERRIIELPDHSQVALDQRTALRVRMTRDARAVDLIEGQAQFMVAHDPRRPFLVEAGASTITAVGTSFNVEFLDARMQVDMVEGKVVVAVARTAGASGDASSAVGSRPALADRTLDLSAGEELSVEPGGQTRILPSADVQAAIAWRQGKIIFKNTPLGEAVRRLNRYSRVQLRITDPSLAQERINGVFELGDALVFADAIQSTLAVAARRIGPDEMVLAPAP